MIIINTSVSVLAQNKQANSYSPTIIDISNIKLVKDATIKLSDIADSVSYITLSKNVLLGEIGLIKPIDDKHFVIFSNQTVYRYTNGGKYVNRLFSSGRAANEAVCLSQPIVNRERNFILVDDNVSTYNKMFSGDGKLLGRNDKTRETIALYTAGYADNLEVIWLVKSNWYANAEKCNPFTKSIFEVRNIESKEIVYKHPNPYYNYGYKINNKGSSYTGNDVCMGRSNNSYWFKIKDMDTVFTTTNFKDIKVKYIIKTPEPKLDFLANMKHRYGALDRSKSQYFRNKETLLTERYLFLDFLFRGFYTYNCCYDTKTKKLSFFESKIINDIDGFCDIENIWSTQFGSDKAFYADNKLYVPIDAIKIIDAGKAKKFPGLTEDSNPIIMVVHLKK